MAQRKRDKPWRCEAMMHLPDVSNVPRESHECTLVRQHYGEHKCWCGTLFTDDGRIWVQPRLPGA